MYYCNEKNITCENANERGNCNLTACVKPTNSRYTKATTVNLVSYNNDVVIYRCEICEQPTDGPENHICPRCRLKLHDLLYNDSNWGKGNWA